MKRLASRVLVFSLLGLPLIGFSLMTLAPAAAPAQTTNQGTETFLVLPQFGYSDDQGIGIGANATWTNIMGSTWEANSSLYSSSLYNQTYLTLDILNRTFDDDFYIAAGGFINNSSRSLFYGIGNNTSLQNETQYAINDMDVYVRAGVRFLSDFVAGVGYNHRTTSIGPGSDATLPQFVNVYPTAPRLSGTTTTDTEVFLMYDTRLPLLAPNDGNFGYMSLAQAQPRSGEDMAQKIFLLTGENYTDLIDKDLILVSRGLYQYEWGADVPFYLQSVLGGYDTLRGYRVNRFIDAGEMLINEETRWSFWDTGGSMIQKMELSFGFDMGRVFEGQTFPPFDGYHINWDLGLTGLLDGGIPMRLDFAFGPEGSLFYLHLYYPF